MRIADTRILACPRTGAPLHWDGTNLELHLVDGELRAADGGAVWPVVDGLPRLFDEARLKGTDRLMRHIHDRLPRAHRPLLRVALPLLQGGGTERVLREALLEHLRLGRLAGDGTTPTRLLEVGIGAGDNVPVLRAALPGGLRAELWGTDLSETLLRRCAGRWGHNPLAEQARLVLADPHYLPFADGVFDRVFHVGGLGRFDDPSRVLAEMFRVVRPGGRVVIVGKRVDPREPQAPMFEAAYRLLTLHEPEVPLDTLTLPDGAVDVIDEQVSRFFFLLGLGRPAVE
ncbi:MAG: methyltransferase domain-containing protein [Deltaproteobacteria bacterium]|nr:MAG: methyltransferase domain-containing protein [Deltaproteobacteria bacterium]